MQSNDIPGAVVGIWSIDKQWIKAFGTSDIESSTPMSADCRFRIGSITKTFVATVILQLVDEGRISLEDPVNHYFPELGIPNGDRITLRHLANMTSGIGDYYGFHGFAEDTYNNPLQGFTNEELVQKAVTLSPIFEPGAMWDYSNTNFILLGMLIEKVTASSLEEEIRTRILDPAGLWNTCFPSTSEIAGIYSHGYFPWPLGTGLNDFTHSNPSVAWAAGAMISNLDDLRLWSEILSEGTLLSEEAYHQMLQWTDVPDTEGKIRYGLGIFYMEQFTGHGGRIVGYTTSMFRIKEEDTTIIVLLNKYDDDDYVGYDTDWARQIFWSTAKVLFPLKF